MGIGPDQFRAFQQAPPPPPPRLQLRRDWARLSIAFACALCVRQILSGSIYREFSTPVGLFSLLPEVHFSGSARELIALSLTLRVAGARHALSKAPMRIVRLAR